MKKSTERPIAFNRQLLTSDKVDTGLSEFFNIETKTHVMRFNRRPDQWLQYQTLRDAGIVVPDLLQTEGFQDVDPEDFNLVIPTGAVSIHNQLAMIKRDTDTYSPVLIEAGEYLGEIYSKTGLVPVPVDGRTVLDSVMIYGGDPSSDGGIEVLLVPPLYLEAQPNITDLYLNIEHEIKQSNIFSDSEQEQLSAALLLGMAEWHEAH